MITVLFVLFVIITVGGGILGIVSDTQKNDLNNEMGTIVVGDNDKSFRKNLVGYDDDNKKYLQWWIPDQYYTENSEEVGGIVHFSSSWEKKNEKYSNRSGGMARDITWELETIRVSIIDRSTARTIGEQAFEAYSPNEIDSREIGSKIYVDREIIRDWIREQRETHLSLTAPEVAEASKIT